MTKADAGQLLRILRWGLPSVLTLGTHRVHRSWPVTNTFVFVLTRLMPRQYGLPSLRFFSSTVNTFMQLGDIFPDKIQQNLVPDKMQTCLDLDEMQNLTLPGCWMQPNLRSDRGANSVSNWPQIFSPQNLHNIFVGFASF